MSFYPPDKDVPDCLATKDFVLMPLRPSHVHIDYEAVMSSQKMLRLWSGSPWPREGFTLAENLADLQWHDQEHQDRVAFTYTILDPDQETCLGCVYIRPLTDLVDANPGKLDAIADNVAIVRFWVRTSLLDSKLNTQLLKSLVSWFAQSWYFSHLYFHTRSANTEQVALFETAEMENRLTLQVPKRGGMHFFYKAVPAP
jgi:RimJ/RimL family protein N-acetyltransferase